MIRRNGVKKGMKKFAMRRTGARLGKRSSVSTTTVSLKVENYDYIVIPVGGNTSVFATGVVDYMSFAQVLTNNSAFQFQRVNYSKYRINGCSIEAIRCCTDFALNNAFTTTNAQVYTPAFFIPYPTLTGASAGSFPSTADNNFIYKPFVTEMQSKYWAYGKEFLSSGVAVGTWNNVGDYATQLGQVSVYHSNPISPNGGAKDLYHAYIKVTLYVQFAQQYR